MVQMEIERKFIIRKPAILPQLPCKEMVQTYLISLEGTRRVRQVKSGGEKQFYFTSKIRRSDLSCVEDEREISEEEYREMLIEADPTRKPIEKTRYYYTYNGLVFEIDEYPFWHRQCVMEVELEQETQVFRFPPDVEIIQEVTHDKRYKNVSLAKSIPEEMI